jgi:hypothetical protein
MQQTGYHSAFISTLGPMALRFLTLGKFALSSDFLFSDFRQIEAKAILGNFLIDVLWFAHRKLNLAAGIKKSRVFDTVCL